MPGLVQKAAVKQIEFTVDRGDDVPQVYCDADKVGRVIINLVTNAMKFCGDPGRVSVWSRFEPCRDEVVVGVTDNGQGLAKEQLCKLFKRFKQLHRATPQSAKGFGLGLSIAKQLVALNFGEIQVQSAVGEGSTFSFTIPVASPPVVVRRYLDFLVASKCGSLTVPMLSAEIDADATEKSADEMDSFLNYLLRQHDLLFRRDQRSWLIVLGAGAEDVEGYVKRVEREHRKANRNRPFGPLPNYQLRLFGTWNISERRESLLEAFDGLFSREEAVCTT